MNDKGIKGGCGRTDDEVMGAGEAIRITLIMLAALAAIIWVVA